MLLFLAAAAVFLLSSLLGAWQWSVFLRPTNLKIPFFRVIVYYFTGLFFNNLLVSNVGGDIVRAIDVSRSEKKTGKSLASIFVDRIFGLSCLIFLGNLSILYFWNVSSTIVLLYLLLDLGVIAVFLFIFSKFVNVRVCLLLKKLPWQKVRTLLLQVLLNVGRYRRNKGVFLRALPIGLVNQGLKISVAFIVAVAMQIPINLVYFFIFIPILGTVLVLPVTINGVGLRETVGNLLFATAGFNNTDIVTVLFMGNLAIMLANLLSGVFFLFRKKKNQGALDE